MAELIQRMVPGAERVRFANTGTEAAMAAIRLARGYTGRPKFIKFEGHYHGWYDDFLVSSHPQLPASLGHRHDPVKIPDSSGLNRHALDDTIVVPWNDLEAVERAIDTWRGQVAAVITEGVMANIGVIPPEPGYLQGLRELTRSRDVLLILDETVTGFRIAPGGCQEHYGVTADIATFGKALGAGLPVAALVGRADIMDALAWGGVLHYGTQNASRVGLYAARASLQALQENDGAAFRHTWRIGERLADGLAGALRRDRHHGDRPERRADAAGHVHRAGRRSATTASSAPTWIAERSSGSRWALFRHGVYMSPSAALHSVASLAHTDDDVAATLEAARKALDDVGR